MLPTLIVFAYLAVVLYIGIFAFRSSSGRSAEDFFLAGRSLGPAVFLLSLFGANMTAFSILGASGHAFANGIVTYGLMASSSGLVIPSAASTRKTSTAPVHASEDVTWVVNTNLRSRFPMLWIVALPG